MAAHPEGLKPTEFGKLVYRYGVDPVVATEILVHLQNTGDVEQIISQYKQFLDTLRIWAIKREKLVEGTYEVTVEDYKKIERFDVEKPNCNL